MKTQLTKIIFWFLLAVFILVVSEIMVSAVTELFEGSILFLLPLFVLFILGLALVLSVLKEKVEGPLRKFLLLTGASALGFFAGAFLHNFFYALAELSAGITALNYIFQGLHVFFFFVAVPISPIGFLVGIVGSILLIYKSRKAIIK